MKIKKVNAFTETLRGGNPAGVVIDSPELTEYQMKYITKTLLVSETAFVFQVMLQTIKYGSFHLHLKLIGVAMQQLLHFLLWLKKEYLER